MPLELVPKEPGHVSARTFNPSRPAPATCGQPRRVQTLPLSNPLTLEQFQRACALAGNLTLKEKS